ncbi:MAG: signal recognition particle-docking protein FtsY [Verrucomicrobiales bacterium]
MGLLSKLKSLFVRQPKIDWEDLEAFLIQADLGPDFTDRVIATLRGRGSELQLEQIAGAAREEIMKVLPERGAPLRRATTGPTVILVTGVNGTGKTTSTAKLAWHLKKQGHRVLLAAADTFRAAAIEQLETWARRIDVPMVKTHYQADPAAVCFEAHDRAVREGFDFLICDTAGRLHTRHNLMEELGKIRRVLARKDPSAPHETLLVVDATTGSNALNQAREFQKSLESLTGLIVTKLDGSGKGGIVIPIQQELAIPVRFIGTGETADDFESFSAASFVERIL